MPVYEYRCTSCGKKFAKLVGMTSDCSEAECPKCGSADVERLISRFTSKRGGYDLVDSIDDEATNMDWDDPRSVSRMMREMGKELADDGEDDMGELIEEAEKEIYDGSDEGESEFA